MPTECGLERGNETGMFLRLNRTVEVSPDTTDMRALEVRGKRRSASGELPTVGVEIVSISPISNDSALNKGARSCIQYFEVNALHLQSLDGEMNIDRIRAISVQFDEADESRQTVALDLVHVWKSLNTVLMPRMGFSCVIQPIERAIGY